MSSLISLQSVVSSAPQSSQQEVVKKEQRPKSTPITSTRTTPNWILLSKAAYAKEARAQYPLGNQLRMPFLLKTAKITAQFLKTDEGALLQSITQWLIKNEWIQEKTNEAFFRYCNRTLQKGTCFGQSYVYYLSRGKGRKQPVYAPIDERNLSIFYQVQQDITCLLMLKERQKRNQIRELRKQFQGQPQIARDLELNKKICAIYKQIEEEQSLRSELEKITARHDQGTQNLVWAIEMFIKEDMCEAKLHYYQRIFNTLVALCAKGGHDFFINYGFENQRGRHVVYMQTKGEFKVFDANSGLVGYSRVDHMVGDIVRLIQSQNGNDIYVKFMPNAIIASNGQQLRQRAKSM